MPGFGNPPDQEPPPELDYDMFLGPAPKRPYNPNHSIYHFRWFWDYSGRQATNLGQHALDLVHWVLGVTAPRSVYSLGGRWFLKDNCEVPDKEANAMLVRAYRQPWDAELRALGVEA